MAEKEYIAKEFVINTINELKTQPVPKTILLEHLQQIIEDISANDVIPVVRCKNCKYAKHWYGNNKLGNETFLCYFLAEEGIKMFADNFCSYGERKESYNGKD